MIPHPHPVARRPLPVENDNGACRCHRRTHTWDSGDCDAAARGEQ